MKLYVKGKKTGKKIYIKATAKSRSALAKKIGGSFFKIRSYKYSVNEVFAEKDGSDTATGAGIGGLIGLVGGPIGFIIGGTLGGLIGNSSDSTEEADVKNFNSSWYEKVR